MKLKDVFTTEDIKKLEQIDRDIELAKEKIILALKNDLGINYILDADSLEAEEVDFTTNLNVIPSYLDVINGCYNDKKEILKEGILRYKTKN